MVGDQDICQSCLERSSNRWDIGGTPLRNKDHFRVALQTRHDDVRPQHHLIAFFDNRESARALHLRLIEKKRRTRKPEVISSIRLNARALRRGLINHIL